MTRPATRQEICKTADVPINGIRQFGDLCIVNAGDRFFACQASCPHEGVALCEGVFDGEVLTCLEHLWHLWEQLMIVCHQIKKDLHQ